MPSLMIPKSMILILVAMLTLSTRLTVAEDGGSNPDVTPGLTTTDLLVARPAGLVATVVGSAIFVIGLPFTLINGSTEQSAQQLVTKPANYTFTRPLGQDMGGLGDPK